RYKLMHFYKEGIWELYDLETDPTEMQNIYGKKGTERITRELKLELARLQNLYKVPEEYR
ncbi:MAG: sulfatase/phosphatase domain-containing protein, partial [Proteiniphilum sp.]